MRCRACERRHQHRVNPVSACEAEDCTLSAAVNMRLGSLHFPPHRAATDLMFVQEPTLVAALETVQAAVQEHDARLKRACVATCSVHITLGVFHSESGEPAIKATR